MLLVLPEHLRRVRQPQLARRCDVDDELERVAGPGSVARSALGLAGAAHRHRALARLLVAAQPLEHREAQRRVLGPLAIAHLHDELGLDPQRVAAALGARERRLPARLRDELGRRAARAACRRSPEPTLPAHTQRLVDATRTGAARRARCASPSAACSRTPRSRPRDPPSSSASRRERLLLYGEFAFFATTPSSRARRPAASSASPWLGM